MASSPGSMLNMENIIRKVFDNTNDSLRITGGTGGGPTNIVISSSDDSIAIGNVAGDLMTVNPDGSINTNILGVVPVLGRVPVDVGGATINITGPVTVSNEVEIKNDVGSPIPVNGTVSVSGVSTVAEQLNQSASLTSIDSKLTNLDIRDLVFATDKVDVSNSTVSLSPATISAIQPATGVSTLAEQQSQTTRLANIEALNTTMDTTLLNIEVEVQSLNASTDVNLSTRASEVTLSAVDTKVASTNTKLDSLLTELQLKADLTETQPVSAASLPLPTGAATSALQTTGNSSLSSVDSKIPTGLTVTGGRLQVEMPAGGTGLTDAELRASDVGVVAKNELYASFSPDPSNVSTGTFFAPAMDARGRVESHGTVLTDEGSFRDDFIGASLNATITGTATLTNGSISVVGVGTSFTTEIKSGQYIKKTTDSETLYVKVSYVIDDLNLELVEAYTGTTGSASIHISNWITSTGTGSIAITNSELIVGSGTAAGTIVVQRTADYGPLNLAFKASLSQRIANQTTTLGLRDNVSTPNFRAEFRFNGTDNTTITCTSASGTTANDIQSTIITLPNGSTTAQSNRYQVFLSNDRVSFLVNGVVEAEHFDHIPGNYDILQMCSIIENTAVVTNTNINLDWSALYNINQVEIQNSFNAKPLYTRTSDNNANGSIAALSGSVTVDATEKSSVIFNVQGTWVGTISLQASTDNVNWFALNGIYESTGQVVFDITTGGAIVCPVGGFKYCRAISTAWTSGTALININASVGVQAIQPFNNINAPLFISNVGQTRRVYSAANTAFTAANVAQDFFTITGSATRTVRVLRIGFSATQTVLGTVNIQLLKRSTANTGGTSTVRPLIAHDSVQVAGTATVLSYTANPTAGTLVGVLKATRVTVPAPASAVSNDERLYDFTDRPIVLRGINEVLALNLNGVTVTGNIFSCFIEFTEE